MTVIIDNSGYFAASEEIAFTDIEVSAGIEQLEGLLDDPGVRIIVDGFADGRFLTVGRQLRRLGYSGHLRAAGNLLPDQFPMALRVGFDSVEISDAHAARCLEEQWVFQASRTRDGYQSRLAN